MVAVVREDHQLDRDGTDPDTRKNPGAQRERGPYPGCHAPDDQQAGGGRDAEAEEAESDFGGVR